MLNFAMQRHSANVKFHSKLGGSAPSAPIPVPAPLSGERRGGVTFTRPRGQTLDTRGGGGEGGLSLGPGDDAASQAQRRYPK